MAEKAEKMIAWLFFDEIMNIWKSYMRIPWVPEVFSRMGWGTSWAARAAKPREKTSGAECLDLLCWMDLDLVSYLSIKSVSQANSKVITKEGTTRWRTKSHTISRITSLSFHRNHCLKRNLVTVQFSLIYVALVWAAIHSSKFGSVNH